MIQHLKSIGIAGALIASMLVYNHWVENPSIAKAAQDLATSEARLECLQQTATAAARARDEAEAYYTNVSRRALGEFKTASAARESLHRQVQQDLEEDIRNYEQQLETAGRMCRFDRGDFEWLRGVR